MSQVGVSGGSAAVEHNAFHDAHINLKLRTSMQMHDRDAYRSAYNPIWYNLAR